MKKKMKYGDFRKLVESMLREEEVPAFQPSDQQRREGASLDNQIDDYLADYESEAQNAKNEGFDIRSFARKFLNEAEGDEEDPEQAATDAAADSAGGSSPLANLPGPAAAPTDPGAAPTPAAPAQPDPSVVTAGADASPKLGVDAIDMESFASSVNRLIENAPTLLEIQNVVFRRAFNYVLDHYEPEAVKLFTDIMRDEYAINDEDSEFDIQDTDMAAPAAVGAGPEVETAAGGGGGGV